MNRLISLLVLLAMIPAARAAATPMTEPDTVPLSEAPIVSLDSLTMSTDSLQAPDEEMLTASRMAANAVIAGTWKFDGPSVDARGSNFVSRLGKPIAKSKLKKGLKKAYDKLKLKKRWTSFVLTREGRWSITLLGKSIGGRYDYDPATEQLVLHGTLLKIEGQAYREGEHLHMQFEADKFLTLMRLLGKLIHADVLKSLAKLSNNYYDVKVGFDFKQVR
ncbi:MAG: DUF4923 family protein [Muribaculaceae bacterium]|nr:DUF4923 family protein [Muribaculaceae bacterium]